MCVFLRDSARVLSKPTGNRETLEMKTYTLKIFNSQAKLPFPDSKHWDLSWNFDCVWLSWQKVNHVCPWGKWGSRSNWHNNSILPERPRPCVINEKKQRRWNSTSVSASVVATTITLQNFGLHPISEPPLRVSLDGCTHSGSLRELVWVFAATLFVHFTQVFACWCQSHACDHVLVMLKVFTLCVHVVFAM